MITNSIFGGMKDFAETFTRRIHRFLEQLAEGAKPEEIDGSGGDGLAAQAVIDANIRSLETGTVVNVDPTSWNGAYGNDRLGDW